MLFRSGRSTRATPGRSWGEGRKASSSTSNFRSISTTRVADIPKFYVPRCGAGMSEQLLSPWAPTGPETRSAPGRPRAPAVISTGRSAVMAAERPTLEPDHDTPELGSSRGSSERCSPGVWPLSAGRCGVAGSRPSARRLTAAAWFWRALCVSGKPPIEAVQWPGDGEGHLPVRLRVLRASGCTVECAMRAAACRIEAPRRVWNARRPDNSGHCESRTLWSTSSGPASHRDEVKE